ncbi:hypothetical protein VZT92_022963 [Zoarces viviparus]|uniref:Uncharacterized protein n=1 Tax=Zoarces viviparus TaxID=48416 RepID=A0AAW1E521_ZOAVI
MCSRSSPWSGQTDASQLPVILPASADRRILLLRAEDTEQAAAMGQHRTSWNTGACLTEDLLLMLTSLQQKA